MVPGIRFLGCAVGFARELVLAHQMAWRATKTVTSKNSISGYDPVNLYNERLKDMAGVDSRQQGKQTIAGRLV